MVVELIKEMRGRGEKARKALKTSPGRFLIE